MGLGTLSASVLHEHALPDSPRVYRSSFGFVRPAPLALFRNSHATPRHSLHSLTAHTRHMGPLVSISSPTLKLCVPTCSTVRHTTPALILAWFDGGDSPNMATIHAQVDRQPGTKKAGQHDRQWVRLPTGLLQNAHEGTRPLPTCVSSGVQQPTWHQPKPLYGRSTPGFSIRRIWRTPAALCAHTSSLLVRYVPASTLADGDVLICEQAPINGTIRCFFFFE